jgi:hypothetical protein
MERAMRWAYLIVLVAAGPISWFIGIRKFEGMPDTAKDWLATNVMILALGGVGILGVLADAPIEYTGVAANTEFPRYERSLADLRADSTVFYAMNQCDVLGGNRPSCAWLQKLAGRLEGLKIDAANESYCQMLVTNGIRRQRLELAM